MTCVGPDSIALYNSLPEPLLGPNQQLTVAMVKQRFTDYFEPKINITFERFKFHKMAQQVNEKVEEFVGRLRVQAKRCEFQHLQNEVIRDQLVIGLLNEDVRKVLLAEDPQLEAAVSKARASELANNAWKKCNRRKLPK
ncbi:hypothetical protein RI129_000175 [Pyrocoelia pectoralis]|uniref:Retrotransposon gag domain-containing protein n=1 Tax=Pyrocoelia pectoralis TaxID=417401 RepID=A0AAN7V6Q6_9COLE